MQSKDFFSGHLFPLHLQGFVLSQNSYDTYYDVELPNIPLMKDTNNLSVDTTVQPFEVYLKGKIESL